MYRNKILYVDDEEINLFIFKKRFENELDVITASSGEEALKILASDQHSFTALISDLRMPEMDGLTLVNKAKEKFKDLSYFILTGYEFNPELEVALEEHIIDDVFKKPFDFDQILSALEP